MPFQKNTSFQFISEPMIKVRELGDLPLEVLEQILLKLDNDSLVNMSRVSLFWMKLVHGISCLPLSGGCSDLKDKMLKCGWVEGEHDMLTCKCIELYCGLYSFIGGNSIPIIRKFDAGKLDNTDVFVTSSKVILGKVDESCRNILAYDLEDENRKPKELKKCRLYEDGHLKVYDKTLVISDNSRDVGYQIAVWNVDTFDYLTSYRIFFDGKINVCKNKTLKIKMLSPVKMWSVFMKNHLLRISGIAVGKNKIIVHIEMQKDKDQMTTAATKILYWSLNTSAPGRDNLKFVSMIEVTDLYRWSYDYIQINERFICIGQMSNSEIYNNLKKKFRIHVYDENLEKFNQFEFDSEIQDDYSNLQLAPGISNKLSFISTRILKMFDVETGHCILSLPQNQEILKPEYQNFVFMGVGNYCVGNMIFISYKEDIFYKPIEDACKFIIVTEGGDMVIGKSFDSSILSSTKNRNFQPVIVNDDSVISWSYDPTSIKVHLTGNYFVIVHCAFEFFYNTAF